MTNMIQGAKAQVAKLTQAAYEKAAAEGLLPAGAEVRATVEIPKDTSHGDYASSFAIDVYKRQTHHRPAPGMYPAALSPPSQRPAQYWSGAEAPTPA